MISMTQFEELPFWTRHKIPGIACAMKPLLIAMTVFWLLVMGKVSSGGVTYLHADGAASLRSAIGADSAETSDTFEEASPTSRFDNDYYNNLDGAAGRAENWFGLVLYLGPDDQLGPNGFDVSVYQSFEPEEILPGVQVSSTTSVSGSLRFAVTDPLLLTIAGAGSIRPVIYHAEPPNDPETRDAALGMSLVDASGDSNYEFELHEQGLDNTQFAGIRRLGRGEYLLRLELFDGFAGYSSDGNNLMHGSDLRATFRFEPVPEPAAWQLLAIAAALVGGAMCRRRTRLRQPLAMLLLPATPRRPTGARAAAKP